MASEPCNPGQDGDDTATLETELEKRGEVGAVLRGLFEVGIVACRSPLARGASFPTCAGPGLR